MLNCLGLRLSQNTALSRSVSSTSRWKMDRRSDITLIGGVKRREPANHHPTSTQKADETVSAPQRQMPAPDRSARRQISAVRPPARARQRQKEKDAFWDRYLFQFSVRMGRSMVHLATDQKDRPRKNCFRQSARMILELGSTQSVDDCATVPESERSNFVQYLHHEVSRGRRYVVFPLYDTTLKTVLGLEGPASANCVTEEVSQPRHRLPPSVVPSETPDADTDEAGPTVEKLPVDESAAVSSSARVAEPGGRYQARSFSPTP